MTVFAPQTRLRSQQKKIVITPSQFASQLLYIEFSFFVLEDIDICQPQKIPEAVQIILQRNTHYGKVIAKNNNHNVFISNDDKLHKLLKSITYLITDEIVTIR